MWEDWLGLLFIMASHAFFRLLSDSHFVNQIMWPFLTQELTGTASQYRYMLLNLAFLNSRVDGSGRVGLDFAVIPTLIHRWELLGLLFNVAFHNL